MRTGPLQLCCACVAAIVTVACGGSASPTAPQSPAAPAPQSLNLALVVDALDYWASAAGITYVLIDQPAEPRLLMRLGTDGLGPQGGGRALIDATYSADNRARSGLVVFEPGGGNYCVTAFGCRYLHRHEIGHALGFLGHSGVTGLMQSGSDVLSDRELRMIRTLYSLPHGARVESDGRWLVAASGESGKLDDLQAAQDVIDWNMNAAGGASFRERGIITRWALPVRVYLQTSWP